MSAQREWKPGDVARIALRNGIVHDVAVKLPLHEGGWATGMAKYVNSVHVSAARPLVVIDPEDREQVERLTYILMGHYWSERYDTHTDAIQAALREFANPTPPKPDEPKGHLAVVEDVDGIRWVSWRDPREAGSHDRPWQSSQMDSEEWRDYRDIDVARVIWEGVTDAH